MICTLVKLDKHGFFKSVKSYGNLTILFEKGLTEKEKQEHYYQYIAKKLREVKKYKSINIEIHKQEVIRSKNQKK